MQVVGVPQPRSGGAVSADGAHSRKCFAFLGDGGV